MATTEYNSENFLSYQASYCKQKWSKITYWWSYVYSSNLLAWQNSPTSSFRKHSGVWSVDSEACEFVAKIRSVFQEPSSLEDERRGKAFPRAICIRGIRSRRIGPIEGDRCQNSGSGSRYRYAARELLQNALFEIYLQRLHSDRHGVLTALVSVG